MNPAFTLFAAVSAPFALWIVRVLIVHRIRMGLLDDAGTSFELRIHHPSRGELQYRACMAAYNSITADAMTWQLHKWTRRQFFPELDT